MRTVLTVDPTTEIDPVSRTARLNVKVERHARRVPQMTAAQRLELAASQLPDWSAANAVAARGMLLRDSLRKHAGIAGVLDNLAQAARGEICPIYVKLNEGEAELFTWEALCDASGKFVALDRRWPIGRITDPATTQWRNEPRLGDTVRLYAVISALGIAGQAKEWRHLRDAARTARDAGLDVRLRVLVGEPALHAAIEKEIAEGLVWTELGAVAGTGAAITTDIRRWQPNIVHFFCHGGASGGRQWLEFGTRSDYQDPSATSGSAALDADEVIDLGTALDNPWLMTLNCCLGARPLEDLTSIAHQVVSTAFPASIAMLEPVDAADAHEFARALYASLFDELRRAAQALQQATRAEFEWACVMHDARVAVDKLHDNDSANRHEWVLPALYVRGVDPMRFERAAPAEPSADTTRYLATANMVAEWLVHVRPTMPEDKRRAVMEDVLAGVPRHYWPDIDGTPRT
jgi:hypothetical protein